MLVYLVPPRGDHVEVIHLLILDNAFQVSLDQAQEADARAADERKQMDADEAAKKQKEFKF